MAKVKKYKNKEYRKQLNVNDTYASEYKKK
jgi:hypothetical protein